MSKWREISDLLKDADQGNDGADTKVSPMGLTPKVYLVACCLLAPWAVKERVLAEGRGGDRTTSGPSMRSLAP